MFGVNEELVAGVSFFSGVDCLSWHDLMLRYSVW